MSCALDPRVGDTPQRERAHVSSHWRVAHAWSSLPGWLVVTARRHVTRLADLTPDEAAAVGPLLRAASGALHAVVGCEKTYAVVFGERVEHVHVHVIPRAAGLAPDARGPAVFEQLARPESEWVPEAERDRLALAIGLEIERALADA